jgi:hypothetical protein
VALLDILIPTLVTNVVVGLTFFDPFVIRDKVFRELPDSLLTSDDNEDILQKGEALAAFPKLSLLQKEQLKELCRRLRMSTGLSRDRREGIVQMCAGASLLTAFVANVIVILATVVFTIAGVKAIYRLWVVLFACCLVVVLVFQIWQIAARLKLSEVEEYHLSIPYMTRGGEGPTWGLLLRLELMILNLALFCVLDLAMPD